MGARRLGKACCLLLSIVLSTVAGCGSRGGPSPAASYTPLSSASPYLATVSVGGDPGLLISPQFLGLANEWGGGRQMMGSSETGVNTIYRTLIRNLLVYGAGPMVIRIGGNSTDTSGEPAPDSALPFAEMARDLGAHFYLGVNLGADNVSLARDQAKAYIEQMPAGYLDAIEIGNEPDLYVSSGLRSPPYTFQDYLKDFNTWRQSISPLLPSGTLLLGASWAHSQMLSDTPAYTSAEHLSLRGFSQHFYPGDLCEGNVSLPSNFLLLNASATSGASDVASAVSVVHGYGLPFRIGEINSIACDSEGGLSDTFSSALWAIDTMFEYASVGVDGVNWHFSNGQGGAPFSFVITTANGQTTYQLAAVNPIYYGMLFFEQATAHNSSLLPVEVSTNANLKVWATIDSSGTVRLSLINKDTTASGTIQVSLAGFMHASVLRLTAPSYLSLNGVAFAGQTFDGSTDGTIQGAQSIESISVTAGSFQIAMAPVSAALVIFAK